MLLSIVLLQLLASFAKSLQLAAQQQLLRRLLQHWARSARDWLMRQSRWMLQ
jgi:hypothetical protein